MKMDMKNLMLAFCVATIVSLGIWLWEIYHTFVIPGPWWEALPRLLSQGFDHPQLRPITLKAMALSYGGVAFFLWLLWRDNEPRVTKRVLSGALITNASRLASITRENKFDYWLGGIKEKLGIEKRQRKQIEVASIPIPTTVEATHMLLCGSTGTGKTTAQDEMLAAALERGDRVIVVDPGGHAISRFMRKGDVVMNPLDGRFPGWSPFNEIRSSYDFDQISKALVTDAKTPEAQEWRGNAQLLTTEILRCLAVSGEMTTERLTFWGTSAPFNELSAMLAGTAASGIFEPGAEKARGSTRFVLTSQLKAFQDIPHGSFSLREWLETGKGNLYIPWRENMRARLQPLISCFVEILMNNVLSLGERKTQPLWMFLDELASLQYLTSLEDALTKGRKNGLRVVAGVQSVAQLEAIYGKAHATVIRSCFRNLLVLGGTSTDPETAKELSSGLGECEVERFHVTKTKASAGTTISESVHQSRETILMPSEITNLPDLEGFLKFAGNYPIGRVRFQHREYAKRAKPFLDR